jgi:DNA-binding MarR family transcriptional regulator
MNIDYLENALRVTKPFPWFTTRQLLMLVSLSKQPDRVDFGVLKFELGYEPAVASRNLTTLVRYGLAERITNDLDHRKRFVGITEKGSALIREMMTL